MDVFLNKYLALIVTFFIAGIAGVMVTLDRWLNNKILLPTKPNGEIDKFKTFLYYFVTLMLSGFSGIVISILARSVFPKLEDAMYLIIAALTGAMGRDFFYNLLLDRFEKKTEQVLDTLSENGNSTSKKITRKSTKKTIPEQKDNFNVDFEGEK